jgi:hypothetical protein
MSFTKLVLAFANQDNNDNKDVKLVSFTTKKNNKRATSLELTLGFAKQT